MTYQESREMLRNIAEWSGSVSPGSSSMSTAILQLLPKVYHLPAPFDHLLEKSSLILDCLYALTTTEGMSTTRAEILRLRICDACVRIETLLVKQERKRISEAALSNALA